MLSENIRPARVGKHLSQEELASRLHVVRQTVSKWEKGLSVPDAELLARLAEELETPVSALLGEAIVAAQEEDPLAAIAAQLEAINMYLVRRQEGRRRIARGGAIAVLVSCAALLCWIAAARWYARGLYAPQSVIGGADGPTGIFVAQRAQPLPLALTIALLAAALFVLARTGRRRGT